jgi:serine/threonine protein kinase
MPNFFTRLSQVFQRDKNSADSKMTLRVGAVINQRYRLDEEIGRGGMGIVYRAHDIPTERDVALKIINLETANALTLSQFSREADIYAKLDHPHIAAMYDTGVYELPPFIVMELVQGTSLGEVHGFTYARIVDIGNQLCDALEHIHQHGYVYRDLKPANIILQKRGFHYFVKLIDFGLARPRGEAYLPKESSLAGTVFYLAPELIKGQPADIGSDLYALGALLYEMITGRVPFFNIDEDNIRRQHLEEPAVPPSHSRNDVPPALESIVLRLLEKDPKDRFASALEVRLALKQVPTAGEAAKHGNLPKTDNAVSEKEIGQVVELLGSNRLATLLYHDDSLALTVGTKLMDQFSDGVWVVNLETVNDPMLVLQTVAAVLGVSADSQRAPTVLLIEYLREKNLLLLLTHCSHVRGACSQLAEAILQTCPDVSILATSDKPLAMPGEKYFQRAGEIGS